MIAPPVMMTVPMPRPEAPAPELGPVLAGGKGRVLEVVRYTE